MVRHGGYGLHGARLAVRKGTQRDTRLDRNRPLVVVVVLEAEALREGPRAEVAG